MGPSDVPLQSRDRMSRAASPVPWIFTAGVIDEACWGSETRVIETFILCQDSSILSALQWEEESRFTPVDFGDRFCLSDYQSPMYSGV